MKSTSMLLNAMKNLIENDNELINSIDVYPFIRRTRNDYILETFAQDFYLNKLNKMEPTYENHPSLYKNYRHYFSLYLYDMNESNERNIINIMKTLISSDNDLICVLNLDSYIEQNIFYSSGDRERQKWERINYLYKQHFILIDKVEECLLIYNYDFSKSNQKKLNKF